MSCKECKVNMYCPDAHTEKSHLCGKALEQEPCDDWYDIPSDEMTLEQARQAVKDLRKKLVEHLEQEPKTGHWFIDERPESDREVICSNCEKPIFKYHKLDFDYRPNFCPNCGAKMRVGRRCVWCEDACGAKMRVVEE